MFRLVSRSENVAGRPPLEPWEWTVHFYRDEDVIEFAGSYFEARTCLGGHRKWAPVIPSEDGWTAAEWSHSSQSWVPKVYDRGGPIPWAGLFDRG